MHQTDFINPKIKENQGFPLKYILELVKPFRFLAWMFLLTLLLSSFLESFGFAILFPLFENILGNESDSQLYNILTYPLGMIGAEVDMLNICIFFLVIMSVKISFRLLNTYFSHKLCFEIRQSMMVKISDYYLSSLYEDIVKQKQGTLINNLVNEPNKATAGMMKLNEFLINLFLVIFFYGLLLITNFKVALILSVVSIIVYILFSSLAKKYLRRFGEQEIAFNQEINSISAESISALRQIKTFGIQDIIKKGLRKNVKGLTLVTIKYELFQALPRSIIELLLFSGIVVGIIVLKNISHEYLISVIPILTMFVIVSQRLFTYLTAFISTKTSLSYYLPAIVLTQSLLNKSRLIKLESRKKNIVEIKSLKTDIVFNDVTFTYDDKKKPVFSNLCFSILKGKTTAIIGNSGSGKSTIADLILALYSPNSGKISLNGYSLNDFNIVDWRKRIGFVSQDNFLFHNTILENIRFGNLAASDEMVIKAAKQANAHDFILGLPEEYETIVGDRGMLMSGGQKQRVAIARALVRDPEILIFDEATSALDYKTEKEIQKEIFNISKGKTVLIISHRLETVKNVDKILKIENGKISKINFQDIHNSVYE